ncbi:Pentatricopeptide repeat-containing protein [Apostasia shenzhenica]|uniref:Pentatricopeptide repeat-containing protein n=1 Tax=Apostasia shenzhenica TaxID=1088818 RepID=A0A2I0AA15_9ASPA|nr:Pentatricopeptide repeat-containing protein [Apostasia shenzhenica]
MKYSLSSLSYHIPFLFQRSNSVPQLLQLQALLLKTALDHHQFFATQLISSLCRLSVRHAHSVLDRLPFPPSLFAWNSLIRAYAEAFQSTAAFQVFSNLRRFGAGEADFFTYPFVLKACAQSSMLGEGRVVHGLVVKAGMLADSHVRNTLLHLYGSCRTIWCAWKVFDEMRERDVVSWSCMIEACVACSQPSCAVSVFQEMRLSNINPNSVTLVSLLSACSHLTKLKMGRSIHSFILLNNIKLDISLGTALILMYNKCGQVNDSLIVFSSMEGKNLQTWTIMISGFAHHGKGKEAVSLFNQMEAASSLKPDSLLFSAILSACSHSGLVAEGQSFFSTMVDVYRIKPVMEHYGCMVDLLGRAGLVEEAYKFIKEMPVSPNNVILRSFLSACRKHGSVSESNGRKLVEQLLTEEPELGANYVLAADLSSVFGRWSEAFKLRGAVKGRRLKKVTGCSWV